MPPGPDRRNAANGVLLPGGHADRFAADGLTLGYAGLQPAASFCAYGTRRVAPWVDDQQTAQQVCMCPHRLQPPTEAEPVCRAPARCGLHIDLRRGTSVDSHPSRANPRPKRRRATRCGVKTLGTCQGSSEARHDWRISVRLRLICDTVASLDARHSRNASGAERGRAEIPGSTVIWPCLRTRS